MVNDHVAVADGPDALLVAARIWAAATTHRDGLAEPARAECKVPGLRSALGIPGASLHLATREAAPVGFTLLVPADSKIEVRYLGVVPEAWGQGVGALLLDHISTHARARGYAAAELWVLDDNRRAIDVYVRAGWRATEDVKCQVDNRRTETRLELPMSKGMQPGATPDSSAWGGPRGARPHTTQASKS